MTPTKEQFDQWFAKRYPDTTSVYSEFKGTTVRDLMREAHAAGLEQGLREAALICRTTPPEPFRPSIEAAHAIEQLRACGSAATPG